MAVTSPTPCAGWTALSPTLKLGAGAGGGTWMAMPGGGPGRTDGRADIGAGGAGGGTDWGARTGPERSRVTETGASDLPLASTFAGTAFLAGGVPFFAAAPFFSTLGA